jgi:hypothetical protein
MDLGERGRRRGVRLHRPQHPGRRRGCQAEPLKAPSRSRRGTVPHPPPSGQDRDWRRPRIISAETSSRGGRQARSRPLWGYLETEESRESPAPTDSGMTTKHYAEI